MKRWASAGIRLDRLVFRAAAFCMPSRWSTAESIPSEEVPIRTGGGASTVRPADWASFVALAGEERMGRSPFPGVLFEGRADASVIIGVILSVCQMALCHIWALGPR